MTAFTIENETDNITADEGVADAMAVPNSEYFCNDVEFAGLAENWSN